MKTKILFVLAFVSHPIFLPLLMNLPGWEIMRLIVAVGIALALPVVLFSLRGIDLVSPSIKERQLIYYVLAFCYALLFAWSWLDSELPTSFGFAMWSIGLLIFGFIVQRTKMNISWHAMGWGMTLFFLRDEFWVLTYAFGIKPLGSPALAISLAVFMGLAVLLIRYLQNAHTVKELLLGYGLGIVLSIFVPIIFQWSSIA
ncbi:MAG: hypothetical protein JXR19_09850 [Bacteroidia bacterium]